MADENARPIPDLSGIMSMISENPALMDMASSILSGLPKPDQSPQKEEDMSVAQTENEASVAPPPSFDPELFSKIIPLINGKNASKASPADERRCALLRALRPYLSPERREAIDYMLKFSQLGDLLQTMQHKT